MTRAQRRSLWRTTQLGLLLTLIVMLADFGGLLEPLERYFYDLRARHCQYFTPPPTDRIVHLDIDDQSIAQIGRWPWSRSVIANLIDEISRAGAKVIALDILYGQPEKPELTRSANGTLVEIDHDRMLAELKREVGRLVVQATTAVTGKILTVEDQRRLSEETSRQITAER